VTDTFDKAARSDIMAHVRHKDTGPEMLLRKSLFAKGLRYRLHVKALPGCPDLVFPRYHAVIFVHGCLWHWHGCKRSRMPSSNTEYWTTKIARNRKRDSDHLARLLALKWRVIVVWECTLKRSMAESTANMVASWILSKKNGGVIEPSREQGNTNLRFRLFDKEIQEVD